MASKVSISNRALSLIGSRSYIDSLEELSVEAEQCNLHFDEALESTFRDQDWNFAKTFTTLAAFGTAPNGWCYQYAYPNKCMAVRAVTYNNVDYPFERGNVVDGGNDTAVIWTNIEDPTVRYTRRIDDPTLWPSSFRETLAAQLGALVCMPLTRDLKLFQTMQAYYAQQLNISSASDAREGREEQNPNDATWIDARN